MSNQLPPDPDNMNEDRAKWASVALLAFMEETGTEAEDALCDILCDLMHLADRRRDGEDDFEAALRRARGHYEEETAAEEGDDSGGRFPEPDYDNPWNEDIARSGPEGR